MNDDREFGIAVLRVSLGLTWAFSAILSWQPQFQGNFLAHIPAPIKDESFIIQMWVGFWHDTIAHHALLFAQATACIESLLALFLILGLFCNLACCIGFIWSIAIWSIKEVFGGPYVPGHNTNIGVGIIYAFCFLLLYVCCTSAYGIDAKLKDVKFLGRLCAK